MEILKALLKLPTSEKFAALKIAKNKESVLGNYLLDYKQGPWDSLFSTELSASSFEKAIDAGLNEIQRITTLASTTNLHSECYINLLL